MVLKIGNRYVSLVLEPCYPLAVVERTTARCLKHQQLAQSLVGRTSKLFKRVTRCATTDAFSGNIAAEGSIAHDRDPQQCSHLHILCGTHATSGVYTNTFAPLDAQVSGAIHTALALRTGPATAIPPMC